MFIYIVAVNQITSNRAEFYLSRSSFKENNIVTFVASFMEKEYDIKESTNAYIMERVFASSRLLNINENRRNNFHMADVPSMF